MVNKLLHLAMNPVKVAQLPVEEIDLYHQPGEEGDEPLFGEGFGGRVGHHFPFRASSTIRRTRWTSRAQAGPHRRQFRRDRPARAGGFCPRRACAVGTLSTPPTRLAADITPGAGRRCPGLSVWTFGEPGPLNRCYRQRGRVCQRPTRPLVTLTDGAAASWRACHWPFVHAGPRIGLRPRPPLGVLAEEGLGPA
jgi:hypothetical protein